MLIIIQDRKAFFSPPITIFREAAKGEARGISPKINLDHYILQSGYILNSMVASAISSILRSHGAREGLHK